MIDVDSGASEFKAPKSSSQILNRNDAHKCVKISHDMYEDDDTNHDYLEKDVHIDDLVTPFSNVDAGDDDSDGGKGDANPLQVQIRELEVDILTAKQTLL